MSAAARLAASVAALLTALATVGAAVVQVSEVLSPTKVDSEACAGAIETMSIQLSSCLQGTRCD